MTRRCAHSNDLSVPVLFIIDISSYLDNRSQLLHEKVKFLFQFNTIRCIEFCKRKNSERLECCKKYHNEHRHGHHKFYNGETSFILYEIFDFHGKKMKVYVSWRYRCRVFRLIVLLRERLAFSKIPLAQHEEESWKMNSHFLPHSIVMIFQKESEEKIQFIESNPPKSIIECRIDYFWDVTSG